jgi:hypothetical protein
MITIDSHSRSSAQVALEDNVFHELFGMIWTNNGYVLKSSQDLSWTIFCKDFFLQGLSDYVNEGFVKSYHKKKMAIANHNLIAYTSAKKWVESESPFNNPEVLQNLRAQITVVMRDFHKTNPTQTEIIAFNRKMDKARAIISTANAEDPFSFDRCCEVLGLKPEVARARFMLYRKLKLKHGHKIRIVTYTGSKKVVNIPSLDDIIEAEEANGEHDLTLFLHVGIKRELRNSALVRSKNERPSQRDSK